MAYEFSADKICFSESENGMSYLACMSDGEHFFVDGKYRLIPSAEEDAVILQGVTSRRLLPWRTLEFIEGYDPNSVPPAHISEELGWDDLKTWETDICDVWRLSETVSKEAAAFIEADLLALKKVWEEYVLAKAKNIREAPIFNVRYRS